MLTSIFQAHYRREFTLTKIMQFFFFGGGEGGWGGGGGKQGVLWEMLKWKIGPLQVAIHVVQNRRTGEQKSHWDKTNKRHT